MADRQDDLRYLDPPPRFAVLRESELDPEQGREDRWTCRGIIEQRSIIRSGLRSRSAACRAAWFVYDDACALGPKPEYVHVEDFDAAVAVALARRHAMRLERFAGEASARMRDRYSVELDTWDHMTGELLAQVVRDAGSVRKACKMLAVPRSTLSAWVRRHKREGTWPQ